MSYEILANGNVIAPARELQNAGEYDVVVCGGGMAGFGAALAAARHGAKVLIIEKATALGGLATVGLVPIPMDTPTGISAEMLHRLEEVDGHTRRNTDPEKHKLILDRMIKEAGIDLLLDTIITDAVMAGNQIRGVVIESKSGRQVIMGKRFIDCTGDADLAYFAGCECMSGRPEDGKHQACSIDFRLGGVDYDK
jgi:ribulose 1,5-bisphosphate synthetase/thiazole synthase